MKRKLRLIVLVMAVGYSAFAQNSIKGIIKDSQGLPVEAATVVIRGTNNYAVTDVKGQFSITTNEKVPFIIRISSVGFKPQDFQIIELSGQSVEITLVDDSLLEEIVVTSRRREETVQHVPIPISVVGGAQIEESGAFNVNRVKELIPSVQLYSSNPRNTGINIRGLGSPFGLTNDGLDPGVGYYVDGVYYARPAAATFDFIDIEQIEVLRGPQGTLFGKNTTSGAFNITTRKAKFTPDADFEVSFGNYGYVQAKSSVTGPLSKKLAARLSFSGTQRDGVVQNIATGKYTNDINNLGFRGQLLFLPTDNTTITLAGDASRQRPDGFAQGCSWGSRN